MTMPQQRSGTATTTALGLLYLGQGIPMGLAFEALPALLREQGFGTQQIGWVGLAMLPWALRFLWAPAVDRRSNGRQPDWLMGTQALLVALYAVMALVPSAGWVTMVIVLLASALTATQNTLADGYAVRVVRPGRLGRVNGLQVGGFALGMVVGGGLVLVLHGLAGWRAGWLLPLALAALTLPVLRYLAPERAVAGAPRARLRGFLLRPGARVMLALAASFYFGRALVGDLMSVLLVDQGLPMTGIGSIRSVATLAMAAGGVIGGVVLIERFGARHVAPVAGLAWALALAGWGVLAASGGDSMLALSLSLADGLAGGITYAAFLALFMAWASPAQAGTDVTLLMCMESISNMVAAIAGGILARHLGLPTTFALAAAIMAAVMLTFAATWRRTHTEGNHADI